MQGKWLSRKECCSFCYSTSPVMCYVSPHSLVLCESKEPPCCLWKALFRCQLKSISAIWLQDARDAWPQCASGYTFLEMLANKYQNWGSLASCGLWLSGFSDLWRYEPQIVVHSLVSVFHTGSLLLWIAWCQSKNCVELAWDLSPCWFGILHYLKIVACLCPHSVWRDLCALLFRR